MADRWETFDSDIRRPAEDFIQNSFNFTLEHETLLREIENNTRNEIAETSKSFYFPFKVASEPTERVFPQDLIVTDNDILRKVLTAIVFLCDEIHELGEMAKSKLFRPLLMFGLTPPEYNADDVEDKNDGKLERMMGHILPTLQEISNFVDRCYSVCLNMVQQLSSLLSAKEQLYKSSFKNVHLSKVFASLGELLNILITFDKIIEQNEYLKPAWSKYKSMISFARTDPASFGTDESKMSKFEHLLVALDRNILSCDIFKGCIEQNYELMVDDDGEEGHINVRGNQTFLNELLICLRNQLDNAVSVIGTSNETTERFDIMGSFALYALYRQLVPPSVPPDAKMQKHLYSIQKVVPVIVLCDKVVWFPPEFLFSFAPFDLKKPDPPSAPQYRKAFLTQFDQSLSARIGTLQSQCSAWFVLAESRLQGCLRHEGSIPQALDLRGSIVLKGLSLAHRAAYLCKYLLVMHSALEVPLNRSMLVEAGLIIESLKAIEFTFRRKNVEISEAIVHMLRQLASACVDILRPIRTKLENSRKLDASVLDSLAVVSTMIHVLQSTDSFSYCRMALINMLTEMIVSFALTEKDGLRFRGFVRRMEQLSSLSSRLQEACDTQFLYFHKESVLASCISSIYANATAAHRLQYVIAAFNDGARACDAVMHSDANVFISKYREYICSAVTNELIQPLCRDIETDLRLHIHTKTLSYMTHAQPSGQPPKQLKAFLDATPLNVLGEIVNIRLHVAHYLNRTFYNLTTVALHDWRTYSDMKCLAFEKFNLVLIDSFLPMGSLDQGLDVLQIMRNIHVFVSRFTYNMNMQQFVEFRPDKSSKHVNTIKIQSIAASIRQHGLGVLNTTVNFTYQFLSQKFHIFSQFLFDDYIRAHLSREHRWYKKHKADPDVNNMYPYDRALKFVRDVRKLGVNEAGKSFLDQFRILITEIGNALGYVRMVRSASMYYCSEAVKFLPEIDDVISFELHAGAGTPPPAAPAEGATAEDTPAPQKVVKGAGLSDDTVRAGKNLDSVIKTLVANFSEGSDYFKVLVNVFQSVLLTSEHEHLRTFMMIVPALCISWIEASLLAKDSMYKATRGVLKEMYFTDDGFAMGLSYCLAILKQTNKCAALHWFDTLHAKHKIDLAQLEQMQAARTLKENKRKEKAKRRSSFFAGMMGGKKEEEDEEFDEHQDFEEVHSLQLTGKRIEAQRRETDQLFYSMSGAAIFFKRTDVDT